MNTFIPLKGLWMVATIWFVFDIVTGPFNVAWKWQTSHDVAENLTSDIHIFLFIGASWWIWGRKLNQE